MVPLSFCFIYSSSYHGILGVKGESEQECACPVPVCPQRVSIWLEAFRWSRRQSRAVGSTVSASVEQRSSNLQKMDDSCHCINWLSETLWEEKLQLLGSWCGSDNDGEIKGGGGWSEGKKGSGSEIKIWKRLELKVSLWLDCGYQRKSVSGQQQKCSWSYGHSCGNVQIHHLFQSTVFFERFKGSMHTCVHDKNMNNPSDLNWKPIKQSATL